MSSSGSARAVADPEHIQLKVGAGSRRQPVLHKQAGPQDQRGGLLLKSEPGRSEAGAQFPSFFSAFILPKHSRRNRSSLRPRER